MPLNPVKLSSGMLALFDTVSSATSPISDSVLAALWADTFSEYMEEISNPPVLPLGHDAGHAAMVAAMEAGLATPLGGAAALIAGLDAYVKAATVAAFTATYVAIPPPSPPTLPTAPLPDDEAAVAMAAVIDAWVRTGKASIPPAAPVFWA